MLKRKIDTTAIYENVKRRKVNDDVHTVFDFIIETTDLKNRWKKYGKNENLSTAEKYLFFGKKWNLIPRIRNQYRSLKSQKRLFMQNFNGITTTTCKKQSNKNNVVDVCTRAIEYIKRLFERNTEKDRLVHIGDAIFLLRNIYLLTENYNEKVHSACEIALKSLCKIFQQKYDYTKHKKEDFLGNFDFLSANSLYVILRRFSWKTAFKIL